MRSVLLLTIGVVFFPLLGCEGSPVAEEGTVTEVCEIHRTLLLPDSVPVVSRRGMPLQGQEFHDRYDAVLPNAKALVLVEGPVEEGAMVDVLYCAECRRRWTSYLNEVFGDE